MPVRSPYETLGVRPSASDVEVRTAYRRLVQLHHPDHNAGSPESARRFEEVQEAYAEIQRLRKTQPRQPPPGKTSPRQPPPGKTSPRQPPHRADPDMEARLADLERQVRAARVRAQKAAEEARERARQAARDAASQQHPGRPTDEELGYITTDDSFTKILSDARSELAGRFADAREHPVVKRVADLIDGLEELASKLDHRK